MNPRPLDAAVITRRLRLMTDLLEQLAGSVDLAAQAGALVAQAIPRAQAGFTDYVRDVAQWTALQDPS